VLLNERHWQWKLLGWLLLLPILIRGWSWKMIPGAYIYKNLCVASSIRFLTKDFPLRTNQHDGRQSALEVSHENETISWLDGD